MKKTNNPKPRSTGAGAGSVKAGARCEADVAHTRECPGVMALGRVLAGTRVIATVPGNAINSGYFVKLGDLLTVKAVSRRGEVLVLQPEGKDFLINLPRSHIKVTDAPPEGHPE